MKKFLFIAVLLATKGFAQPASFERVFHADQRINLTRAAPAPDGGLAGAGTYASALGLTVSYLTRIDSQGTAVWTNMMVGNSDISFRDVVAAPDGGCIASGTTMYAGQAGSVICRIAADGSTSWVKSVAGTQSGGAVALHGNGFVFAGGFSGPSNQGAYLIKTDTSGKVIWSHSYKVFAQRLDVRSISRTADNGLFITGTSGEYGNAGVLFALADSLGIISRIGIITTAQEIEDAGTSGFQTEDGGFIISGYRTEQANKPAATLIKTNAQGTVEWCKVYELGSASMAQSVVPCRGGGYLISGSTGKERVTSRDGFLIRTDDTGGVAWTKHIGGSMDDYLVYANQQADGGIFSAGGTSSFSEPGNDAAYFLKTDPTGGSACHTQNADSVGRVRRLLYIGTTATDDTGAVLMNYPVAPVRTGAWTTVCSSLAVPASNATAGISVLPNPAGSRFKVMAPGRHVRSIILTGISGIVAYRSAAAFDGQAMIDCTAVPSGVYFYQISAADGQVFCGKLLIAH